MASTNLNRTPSSASNRKTWTWSGWVKKSTLGSQQVLFQGGDSGYPEKIVFTASDILEYDYDIAGTDYTVFVTDRRFRDVNGWLHIVVAKDTTQATETDRIKIYVNGEQQSLSEYQLGYPPQNHDGAINNNVEHCLGSNSNGGEFFGGIMSHVHFVDGSALAPTVFGSTDSTTGEWKINTSPSVTYGTNGFFMFKDDNSLNDDSGNGNNFALEAGTLTKTESSPSNVFCTLNPLDAFNTSGRTLSNGNNTYTTSSGNNSEVAGTLAASSGKYYFETKIVSQSGSTGSSAKYGVIGVKKINKGTLAAGEAATIYSDGRKNNGYDSVNNATPGYTLNDIVQVALDLDNNQIFFGLNGNWGDNAGNFNQTFANATALYTSLSTVGEWTPYLNKNVTNDNTLTLSANFGNGYFGTTAVSSAGTNASGNGIFEYDCPSGYTALSTKGLNL